MNSNIKQLILNCLILLLLVSISNYINGDYEKTFMFMGGSYLTSSFTRTPLDRIIKIINKFLPSYIISYDKYFLLYNKFVIFKKYENSLLEDTRDVINNLFVFSFEELESDNIILMEKVNKQLDYYMLYLNKYNGINMNDTEKKIMNKMFMMIECAYKHYTNETIIKYQSIIDNLLNIIVLTHKNCNEEQILLINKMELKFIKNYENYWNLDKYVFTDYLLYVIDTLKKLNEKLNDKELYEEEHVIFITKKIEEYSHYFYYEKDFIFYKNKIDILMILYKKNILEEVNIKEIVQNVDLFLDSYNESLKKTVISDILIQYIGNLQSNKKYDVKPLFLFGSHGTGKTKFVEELALFLNSHLYTFNDINTSNIKCIDKINDSEYSIFTKAIYETKSMKKNNCIIFMDEFDKYFNNINKSNNINITKYLTLLNTDKIENDNDIKMPNINILFIASGNKLLKNIDDILIPLHDRFIIVNFPKIDKSLKKIIIYKKFKIEEDPVINEFIDNDTNDGIRELLIKVSSYIERTKIRKLFENTVWSSY